MSDRGNVRFLSFLFFFFFDGNNCCPAAEEFERETCHLSCLVILFFHFNLKVYLEPDEILCVQLFLCMDMEYL